MTPTTADPTVAHRQLDQSFDFAQLLRMARDIGKQSPCDHALILSIFFEALVDEGVDIEVVPCVLDEIMA